MTPLKVLHRIWATLKQNLVNFFFQISLNFHKFDINYPYPKGEEGLALVANFELFGKEVLSLLTVQTATGAGS